MNKSIIALTTFFMILSFTTMVSAEVQTSASSGAAITFASAADPGPGFTFTPSPSSLVSAFTSATAFTAVAASGKTTGGAGGNGIEYGVVSASNAMSQRVQATSNTVTAASSATALPGTGWATKGGGS